MCVGGGGGTQGFVDGWMGRFVCAWVDGWMNGWVGVWLGGWMDGCIWWIKLLDGRTVREAGGWFNK